MNEREARRAEREARRDAIDHPERSGKHEDDLLRYLGGVFYLEEKAHRHTGGRERPHRPREHDEGR